MGGDAKETRFRLRKGDFEVELSGTREYVEGHLALHLERWLAMAGSAVPEGGAEAVIRVASEADPISTESASTESVDTTIAEFPRVAPDFRPKVNVSIEAFLAMKNAVAPADVVVVAVYYLDKYLQKDTFTVADLQDLLAPLPAWECRRAEDELEPVIAMGYVEKLRDGRLTITYKGQNYVREGLA